MESAIPSLIVSAETPEFPLKFPKKMEPKSLPTSCFQSRAGYPVSENRFHAKKDVSSSHRTPPPTPVAPRYSGISRVGKARTEIKAKRVSFKGDVSERVVRSPFYNPEKLEPLLTQCYDCLTKIGMGSFSEVFMARSKDDGVFYAVKRLNQFASQPDRRRKLEEVKKFQMVTPHQNVIRFYEAWEEKNRLYIKTELCEMSMRDLTQKIHSVSEPVIWNNLYDLLKALKHLHDKNLVHLDVKPANIFMSKDGTCKLGDFGLLVDLSLLGDKIPYDDVEEGDGCYLAPEVLSDSIITKAADIFSLGITILEVATDMELPAHGEEWKELREGIFPSDFVSKISPELFQVIQWMMHPDYQQRPNVDQLLSLPQLVAVPSRRDNPLSMVDEPDRELIEAAIRASTPIGRGCQPPTTPMNLFGAQFPFTSPMAPALDLIPTSETAASVPVVDALNYEFGRGDREDYEPDRVCTPTGTPRVTHGESPLNGQSPWLACHRSSLTVSREEFEEAMMTSEEDNSFNGSASRLNSRNRVRPEHKLSPFVIPSWARDYSDGAILEAPNTAPPAVEGRCVTPDLISSSPLVARLESKTVNSHMVQLGSGGAIRRPSPVALCEVFDQLPHQSPGYDKTF